MRLPKQLDLCGFEASPFMRIFNWLARDFIEGTETCKCCLFWRGFFFALVLLILPFILYLIFSSLATFLWTLSIELLLVSVVANYLGNIERWK